MVVHPESINSAIAIALEIRIASGVSTEAATNQLESALADTMQQLKTAAIARDASAFRMLLSGGRGTGGWYGLGRRVRAIVARKPLSIDHTERKEQPAASNEPHDPTPMKSGHQ